MLILYDIFPFFQYVQAPTISESGVMGWAATAATASLSKKLWGVAEGDSMGKGDAGLAKVCGGCGLFGSANVQGYIVGIGCGWCRGGCGHMRVCGGCGVSMVWMWICKGMQWVWVVQG